MMAINDTTTAANSGNGTNNNPMGALTQVSGNKGQQSTEFITQLAHNPFALHQLEQQSVFVIGLHHCKELVYEIYNVLQYLQENYGEIKGAFRFPAESYYYNNNTNGKERYGRRKIIYSSAVLLIIFESVYSARKACGLTTTPMYTSITYDTNTVHSTIQEQRRSTITENTQSKEKAQYELEQSTQAVGNASEAPKDKTVNKTTDVILPSSEFVNRRNEELNNQVSPKTTMVPFSSSNMLVPSQTSNNTKNVLLPSHYPTHVSKLTYCSQVIQVGNNRIKIEPASHFALSPSAAQRCLQTFIPPQNVSSHELSYKGEREMSLWNSSGANRTNRNMYDNIYNGISGNLLQRDNSTGYNSLYNSNTYNWPNTTKVTNRLSSQNVVNNSTKSNVTKLNEAGYFSATSRLWTLFFSPLASSSSSSSSSISTFESCPSSLLMSYLVDWSAAKAACKRYEAIVINDNDILPFAKGLTTYNNKECESNTNNNYKKKVLGSRYYGTNINNNSSSKGNDEVEDKYSTFTSRLLNTRDIWGKPTSKTSSNININKNKNNLEIDNCLTDRVKHAALDFSKNLVYKRVRSDAIGCKNNNEINDNYVINTNGAIRDNEFAKSTKSDNTSSKEKTRESIVTFANEEIERNTRQRLEGQRFANSITRDDDDNNLCNNNQEHYEEKAIHNLENESILGSVSHKARNAVNYINNWRHHRKSDNTFDKQTPTNELLGDNNNNVDHNNIINNRASGKVPSTNNNISTMYMPDDEFVMKESVQERYFREKYSKPKWLSFSLPWARSTNEELFTSKSNTLNESDNWMGKVAHSVQNGLSSVVKCFALTEEQPLQFDSARGELTSERCNDNCNFNNNNDIDLSTNENAGGEEVRLFTTPLQDRE